MRVCVYILPANLTPKHQSFGVVIALSSHGHEISQQLGVAYIYGGQHELIHQG